MRFRIVRHRALRAVRVSVLFESLAAALLGTVLAWAYAGPLRLEAGPWTLSVRTISRPLVALGVLLLLRTIVAWRTPARLRDLMAAGGRIALGALVAAGVIGWQMHLSATVGGADSYGYVSAAERIARGRLVQSEPLARLLPFQDGAFAAAPLGYVPSPRQPYSSIPAYPLGLPAIMAAASVVGGRDAPFAVAPIAGVLLLAVAASIAWSWYRDGLIALLAASLLAVHPLVFTYSIQPMSDVPAALCVLAGIAAIARGQPLLAGIAGGLALLIRPALAPTVVVLSAYVLVTRGRAALKDALLVAIPIVTAAGAQAVVNAYLYGGLLASGYGGVDALFSAGNVVNNLRSYAYWLVVSLGIPATAAFVVGVAVSAHAPRVMFALVAAALLVTHLPYRPYDHWETLRFLLPAVVLMTIIGAAGLVYIGRCAAGYAGGFAMTAVIALALASSWMAWLDSNGVFTMHERERRHHLAAEMVEQSTPPDAVILALQHSGSVRYYSGRATLNWQRIPAGSLPDTVRALRERGRIVYVMIDSAAEHAEFRARHGDVLEREGWLPAGQRRDVQLYEAPRY